MVAPNAVGTAVAVKWDEIEQGWIPKVLQGDTAWEIIGNIYKGELMLN